MTTTALRDYAWRGSSCTVGALVGSDILATKTMLVTDHEKTGENARRLRKQARVSLREVARRLGVSAAYLSDLERGRRGWDMQRACRFAWAIGANVPVRRAVSASPPVACSALPQVGNVYAWHTGHLVTVTAVNGAMSTVRFPDGRECSIGTGLLMGAEPVSQNAGGETRPARAGKDA